jgi:hypothetical protein
MRDDVLSASMRIANRRVRLSSGMFGPPLCVPETNTPLPSSASLNGGTDLDWKLRGWQINSAILLGRVAAAWLR